MSAVLRAIATHARRDPDATALCSGDDTLSYRALDEAIRHWGGRLPGQVVGLLLDNGPAWPMLDLASRLRDRPCVPLPGFFSDEQLRHVIASTGIDCLVTDQPGRAQDIVPGTETLLEGGLGGQGFTVLRCPTGRHADIPLDIAKVTFTSGTTGTPKGVCLRSTGLDAVALSLRGAVGASPGDRLLSLLPLSTLLENIAVYATLLAGASATLLPLSRMGVSVTGLEVARICQTIDQARPNVIEVVPEILRALVAAARGGWKVPSSLRFLAVGGASVSSRLLEQATGLGLPAFQGYGLSEAGSVVSLNTPLEQRHGSVGRPLPHARVRIAEDGEVMIAGSLFSGYLGEPARAEGYWPSGDLGQLDEDGFLYLTGRKKNLIVTAYGRNLSPEWVEGELTSHPAIARAVVFGDGQAFATALLNVSPGTKAEEVTQAVARANLTLPDYARVRRYHVARRPFSAATGEVTANGRLRRAAIARNFREQLHELSRA